MKGLTQRLITAVFFVTVMLGGVFGGLIPFLILFGIIAAFCLWEFLGIVLKEEIGTGRKVLGMLIGLAPYAIAVLRRLKVDVPEIFLTFFLLLLFLIFIYELTQKSKNPFVNIGYLFVGLIYIGFPFLLLISPLFSLSDDYNAHLIFSVLLLVWASDTGAYLTGSLIGKTPLAPVISPKKTWEGTIGGWVFGFLISIGLYYFYKGELMELWQFLTLAVICGVFGTIGDLVESMLKRSYGIKDSGNILPGHGGMLDRFDAFIFVVPFVYGFLQLI